MENRKLSKESHEALLELFMLIAEQELRRQVFDLLYYLEERYRTELAHEIVKYLQEGKNAYWLDSLLLMRFFTIAKRLLDSQAEESYFDMDFYHQLEELRNQ